jgi:hypothetical protein
MQIIVQKTQTNIKSEPDRRKEVIHGPNPALTVEVQVKVDPRLNIIRINSIRSGNRNKFNIAVELPGCTQ